MWWRKSERNGRCKQQNKARAVANPEHCSRQRSDELLHCLSKNHSCFQASYRSTWTGLIDLWCTSVRSLELSSVTSLSSNDRKVSLILVIWRNCRSKLSWSIPMVVSGVSVVRTDLEVWGICITIGMRRITRDTVHVSNQKGPQSQSNGILTSAPLTNTMCVWQECMPQRGDAGRLSKDCAVERSLTWPRQIQFSVSEIISWRAGDQGVHCPD